MKLSRGMQGGVLVGLLAVSLGLYWAAESSNGVAVYVLLALLGLLAALTIVNRGK
jgi:hypothetical protein